MPTITTFFRHCCPLAFPVYLSIDNGNLDTRKSPLHTSIGISDYLLGTEWIINGNVIFICHHLNLTPHVTHLKRFMKFMNDISKIIIFSCQYTMITSHWFSDDKSICGKYSIGRCKKFNSVFSFELNFTSSNTITMNFTRNSNERRPMPMHCKKGGNRLTLPLKPVGAENYNKLSKVTACCFFSGIHQSFYHSSFVCGLNSWSEVSVVIHG